MKILYIFPIRFRRDALFKCLDNMMAMMHYDDYAIEITGDIDDPEIFNPEVTQRLEAYKNTRIHFGVSHNKVSAINRDVKLFDDWDILILMSNDMEFIQPGFDKLIIQDYLTQPIGDVLMHYPDQAAGSALITMAIMDRKYFNRDGYIYNPEYKSLFCDNEQQEVAKLRGRYKFFKRRLFNHNHPAWGLAPVDALMRHTESFYHEDEITFNRRKAENFGI